MNIYSNELEITYTFNPSTQANANPYYASLINDTLRIDTDYRGDTYNINITVTDSNFNRTNNDINISITEIEPFVLKINGDITDSYIINKQFPNLKNDRLLISLNEYYDINTPVNKTNSININNTFLTDIDITGNTYESNIDNGIITLTFDYRTILTVTNETTEKISLTKTGLVIQLHLIVWFLILVILLANPIMIILLVVLIMIQHLPPDHLTNITKTIILYGILKMFH